LVESLCIRQNCERCDGEYIIDSHCSHYSASHWLCYVQRYGIRHKLQPLFFLSNLAFAHEAELFRACIPGPVPWIFVFVQGLPFPWRMPDVLLLLHLKQTINTIIPFSVLVRIHNHLSSSWCDHAIMPVFFSSSVTTHKLPRSP
jgi:hypothetical protein